MPAPHPVPAATRPSALARGAAALLTAIAAAPVLAAPGSFVAFDHLPQFGIYVSTPPNYVPPPGVVMLDNGTAYMTKLTNAQKALIGADVAAQVTYHAQCDNYDRLGGLFLIVKPLGEPPVAGDTRIEVLRWITPFSDYWQGQYANHAYPSADLSAFAGVLADKTHDVWLGLSGGSNPYGGDPCDKKGMDADFSAVGFKYSVALSSTKALASRAGTLTPIVAKADYTSVPVTGTASLAAAGKAKAVVIVSGHGSASGGDEYKNTTDVFSMNGTAVGRFSTAIDCASYRKYSPDGNPFIFFNNNGSNPRNWCPGALVPSHVFTVPVAAGANAASLDMSDRSVPDGSYYETSVVLITR